MSAGGEARGEQPRAAALAGAALLAGLGGCWAAFQWRQLAVARSGGEPFCALGGDACAQLAASGFATAVERVAGLPVAGWGVVWSAVALALALLTLRRLRGPRSPEPFWSAALLTAVAGVGGVVLLAGVGLREGRLCTNCAITYALVLGQAGLLLAQARRAPPRRPVAALPVAVALAAAAGVALLPFAGRTPRPPGADPAFLAGAPGGPGTAESVEPLAQRIGSLSRPERQALSDARGMYLDREAQVALRPARALVGSPMAPVRITHFSDLLCSHCAHLHEELESLQGAVDPHALSIESRQFPLDAGCNPHVPQQSEGALRCLAAAVMICLEKHPQAFALQGEIFRRQSELDADLLFALAEPYMSRAALERCAASDATREKLADDIDWAMAHEIEGTPLVLVNGRKTLAYLPFLYAMAVTGGDADHPAFQGLPAPSVP